MNYSLLMRRPPRSPQKGSSSASGVYTSQVARGDSDAGSDVDILVDIATDAGGFAYFGLLEDLRRALVSALGCEVDVVDSAGLDRLRDPVLRDAVPL